MAVWSGKNNTHVQYLDTHSFFSRYRCCCCWCFAIYLLSCILNNFLGVYWCVCSERAATYSFNISSHFSFEWCVKRKIELLLMNDIELRRQQRRKRRRRRRRRRRLKTDKSIELCTIEVCGLCDKSVNNISICIT